MAINKKLITFAKKSVFLSQQQGIGSATTPTNGYYNNIPAHSIVFIKDTGEIWHNGKYYSGIERYLTIESGVTDGIIHRQEGVYYLSSYTLWGNTFDGSDPSINGNIYVDNKLAYTTAGIYRYVNNNLEPLLYWSESGYGLTVSQGNLDVNGNITAKANGTTKFEANASTGKVTAAGDIDGLKILNTPSYIAATQTQGKKWIDIKQFESSSPYTPISLADNPPAYLTIQEGTHSADYNWKPWIADGDSTSKSSWGIGLSGDAFYIGRVAKEQTTNALTNAWIFDNEGYITSGGYKKTNSSDLYVLLGGGGHKLETALSVGTAQLAHTLYSGTTNSTDTRGHWTVTIPGITELYDGLTIHIKLGTTYYGNGESYNTLDVNGLGPKIVWYSYNNRLTSHYSTNAELYITYRTTAGSYKVASSAGELTKGTTYTDGWVIHSQYYTTDTTTMQLYYSRLNVSGSGLMQYSLAMMVADGTWQSFTTTGGTGTKTKNTNGFVLGSRIYYMNMSAAVSSGMVGYGVVRENQSLVDLRYSFNISATQGLGLQPNLPLFIVGSVNASDGLFYLDDVWWTQAIPQEENGKVYIKICEGIYADYSTNNPRCYRGDLVSIGRAYVYKRGGIRYYSPEDPWDLIYAPTSVQFTNPGWTKIDTDLSVLSNGSYLISIEDGTTLYSGTFSYYSGTINTDEEILLHACGTRTIYQEDNKPGVLYAKIKPYNNNAALYLGYSHNVTRSGIIIKIKKLASL
jgi:hypothetical protein